MEKGERRVIEEDNQLYDREKEEKIKELKEEYQKALEKQEKSRSDTDPEEVSAGSIPAEGFWNLTEVSVRACYQDTYDGGRS